MRLAKKYCNSLMFEDSNLHHQYLAPRNFVKATCTVDEANRDYLGLLKKTTISQTKIVILVNPKKLG